MCLNSCPFNAAPFSVDKTTNDSSGVLEIKEKKLKLYIRPPCTQMDDNHWPPQAQRQQKQTVTSSAVKL